MATKHATLLAATEAPSGGSHRLWWLVIIAVSVGIWVLAIESFALVVGLF